MVFKRIFLITCISIIVTLSTCRFPTGDLYQSDYEKYQKARFTSYARTYNIEAYINDNSSTSHFSPWATVGSWFLGPRAENAPTFRKIINKIIDSIETVRQETYQWDKPYITDGMKEWQNFKQEITQTETEVDE